MIQRVQTLFLLIAGLFTGITAPFLNIWKKGVEWMQAMDYPLLIGTYLLITVLSLVAIFLYKNRKNQMRMVSAAILLNIVLMALLVFRLLNLPGGFDSEKGIGLLIPFVSTVLLFMAHRGIAKDEKLVKSVDRLR